MLVLIGLLILEKIELHGTLRIAKLDTVFKWDPKSSLNNQGKSTCSKTVPSLFLVNRFAQVLDGVMTAEAL